MEDNLKMAYIAGALVGLILLGQLVLIIKKNKMKP